MHEYLERHKLFKHLTPEQLHDLEQLCIEIFLDRDRVLITEGDDSYDFYIVLTGELSVLKKDNLGIQYPIGKKRRDDLIGELAFLESGIRSATIRTLTPCTFIKIDGEKIRSEKRYEPLLHALEIDFSKSLSENLRTTDEITAKSMQAELKSAKKLISAGRFMTGLVLMFIVYIFSLNAIALLKNMVHFYTPITVGLLIILSIISLIAIHYSEFSYQDYGLTLENWRNVVVEAVIYSLPLMLVVVILKWLAIHTIPAFANVPLFQPGEQFHKLHISPWVITGIAFAYALFCPIQEFLARGMLQSSFHIFLSKDSPRHVWQAIILSNLLFATAHQYESFWFVLLALIPGFFWGWLFSRQQSLLGVSVSHILLGVWSIFIVGIGT